MTCVPRRPDTRACALPAVLAVTLASVIFSTSVTAALPDEIQVYSGEINEPGEKGLEMHINTTPRGIKTPGYPGEVVNHHGLRITPEFSWGLTKTFEAGLYIPTVIAPGGHYYIAGLKPRLKWLPIQAGDKGGWFAGINTELSRLAQKFSESRTNLELRFIVGYRTPDWLVSVNPILGWGLSDGQRERTPEGAFAIKGAHKVVGNWALGAEYYTALGKVSKILPRNEQSHTIYAVLDYEGKGFDVNFGIGRGLTEATDRWTVKMIVGFPL